MTDEVSTANDDDNDDVKQANEPRGWLDQIMSVSDDWAEPDEDTNEPVDRFDPTGRKKRRLAEQRRFLRTGIFVLGPILLEGAVLNILGWVIVILDAISHQSLFDLLGGISWTVAYALGGIFTIGLVVWLLRFRTLNRRWTRSREVEQSLQALTPGETEAERLRYNLQVEDKESSKGRDSRREVVKNLVWTLIGALLGIIASNWGTIYDWLAKLPPFSR